MTATLLFASDAVYVPNGPPKFLSPFDTKGARDLMVVIYDFLFTGSSNQLQVTIQGANSAAGPWTNLSTTGGIVVGVTNISQQIAFPVCRLIFSTNNSGQTQAAAYVNGSGVKLFNKLNGYDSCTACCDECAAGNEANGDNGKDPCLTVLC